MCAIDCRTRDVHRGAPQALSVPVNIECRVSKQANRPRHQHVQRLAHTHTHTPTHKINSRHKATCVFLYRYRRIHAVALLIYPSTPILPALAPYTEILTFLFFPSFPLPASSFASCLMSRVSPPSGPLACSILYTYSGFLTPGSLSPTSSSSFYFCPSAHPYPSISSLSLCCASPSISCYAPSACPFICRSVSVCLSLSNPFS